MGLLHLAFPAIVYECKSDSSSIYFAENQAAGGAAKALRMLEGLYEAAECTSEEKLPVMALCSQGPLWEVWVAFRQQKDPLPGIVSEP